MPPDQDAVNTWLGSSAADWLGAVATAGALMVAVVVMLLERRDKRLALAEADHREAVKFAELVSWWVAVDSDVEKDESGDMTVGWVRYRLNVVNNSPGAIYALRAPLLVPDGQGNAQEEPTWDIPVVPPGTSSYPATYRDQAYPTLARYKVSFEHAKANKLVRYVAFTDANGRRWRREADGRLVASALDSSHRDLSLRVGKLSEGTFDKLKTGDLIVRWEDPDGIP